MIWCNKREKDSASSLSQLILFGVTKRCLEVGGVHFDRIKMRRKTHSHFTFRNSLLTLLSANTKAKT